jgi:hypothetical protein
MYSLRHKDVDDKRPISSHGFVRTENCLKKTGFLFTPLESPTIYAGDGRKRKHQFLIEGGGQNPPLSNGVNINHSGKESNRSVFHTREASVQFQN